MMMEFPSQEALLEELMMCQDENRKFRDRLTRIIKWIRVIETEGVKVPSELMDDLDLSFQNAYFEKQTLQEQLELKIEAESSDENDEVEADAMDMDHVFNPMHHTGINSEPEFSESDSEREQDIKEPADQKLNEIKLVDINSIVGPKPSTSSTNTPNQLQSPTVEPPKNEQKFNCQDCEAEFTTVYALIAHAMIHLTPNLVLSTNMTRSVSTSNKCSKDLTPTDSFDEIDSEKHSEVDEEIGGLSDLDDYVPTLDAPAQVQSKSKLAPASKSGQLLSKTVPAEQDNTRSGVNNMAHRSSTNQQQCLESEKNDTMRKEEQKPGNNERGLRSPSSPMHPVDRSIKDLDDDDDYLLSKPCNFCFGFHGRGACPVLQSPVGRKDPTVNAIVLKNRKRLNDIAPEYLTQRKSQQQRINRINRAKRKAAQEEQFTQDHSNTFPPPAHDPWKIPRICTTQDTSATDPQPNSIQNQRKKSLESDKNNDTTTNERNEPEDNKRVYDPNNPCNSCFGVHLYGQCPLFLHRRGIKHLDVKAIIAENKRKLSITHPSYLQLRSSSRHQRRRQNIQQRKQGASGALILAVTSIAKDDLDKPNDSVTAATTHHLGPVNKITDSRTHAKVDTTPLALKKLSQTDVNMPSSALPVASTTDVPVRRVVLQPRFNPRMNAYLNHPCRWCFNIHPWGPCPMQQRFPVPMRFPFPHPGAPVRVRYPMRMRMRGNWDWQ